MSFWHQKEKQRILTMEKSAANYKAKVVALGICALCLGLVLLGTACPGPTPQCQTDADCTGDLVCNVETGQCEEPPGCTSDADCAEGEVCNLDTGTCEAAPPECTSDADCAEGEVCNLDTGACEAAPVGCTSDADCAEGEVCNLDTGECEAAPAGCTSDDDCGQGEFCNMVTGECVLNEDLFANVTFDHDFHSGAFSCDTCHHDGAGFTNCSTCHNRDEVVGGLPVLKDVMHTETSATTGYSGCFSCHQDRNPDGTRDCSVCHTDLPD
ncbi:MAG: cytochrome c3 family protein [Phycisphaerales bacterium]|nr:MAG: cytochrome c3 family protein [Phycisphaerales bacterium]